MKQQVDFYRGSYITDIQLWSRLDGPNRITRKRQAGLRLGVTIGHMKRYFLRDHPGIKGYDIVRNIDGRGIIYFHQQHDEIHGWADRMEIDIDDMTEDEYLMLLMQFGRV